MSGGDKAVVILMGISMFLGSMFVGYGHSVDNVQYIIGGLFLMILAILVGVMIAPEK